jgi:hypothetical protein
MENRGTSLTMSHHRRTVTSFESTNSSAWTLSPWGERGLPHLSTTIPQFHPPTHPTMHLPIRRQPHARLGAEFPPVRSQSSFASFWPTKVERLGISILPTAKSSTKPLQLLTLTVLYERSWLSLVPTLRCSSPITCYARATSPSSATSRITSLSLDVGSLRQTSTPAVMCVPISHGFPGHHLPWLRPRLLSLSFPGGPLTYHHITSISRCAPHVLGVVLPTSMASKRRPPLSPSPWGVSAAPATSLF